MTRRHGCEKCWDGCPECLPSCYASLEERDREDYLTELAEDAYYEDHPVTARGVRETYPPQGASAPRAVSPA